MESLAPQAFSVSAENLKAPAITSDLVVSNLSKLSNIRRPKMSDFPEMEYQSGDAEPFELAPGETSPSFLQKIYRSPSQPIARRMRAAMAALQHEHSKLTTMAVNSMNGETFAARAIERGKAPPKVIKHHPDETGEGIAWTGPLRDGR
jgi:hypothetical protein